MDSFFGFASGGSDEGDSAGEGSGSGNSWWNNLIKKAKETSMSTIEIIKKDFNEFTETMKHDVNELTHQLQTSEKPLFECVTALSTLSRPGLSNSSSSSLNAYTEHTGRVLTQPKKVIFDRLQSELQNLQVSQDTFLNDPSEQHLEEFIKWSESYDPDTQKGVISNLLIENEALRAIYTQLVPATVTNKVFWTRYFFKVRLIELEHEKRHKLLMKAGKQDNNEENIGWDDDEWNDANKTMTEDREDNSETQEDKTEEDTPRQDEAKEGTKEEGQQDNIEPSNNQENETEEAVKCELRSVDSDDWEKDFELGSEKDSEKPIKASVPIKAEATEKLEKASINSEQKGEDWESWE